MRYPHTLVKFVLLLAALSLPWLALLPESQGAEAWPLRYNGPGNSGGAASALAVDAQGNVYVAGSSTGVGSGPDYATIKYSSGGELLWEKRYNGPGNGHDFAKALAVDAQGNVYVTGASFGVASFGDYATIKYSPDGVRKWVKRYNGPGNGYDTAYALALDAQGNVYVTGSSTGVVSGGDYATIKYNPDGVRLWSKRYNGPGNGYDMAYALAVDAQGNVCVTGGSTGKGSDYDYATIKYSPEGVRLWAKRYNGPGKYRDIACALALDAQGNVHLTGYSTGVASSSDYATIKYSPAGEVLWAKRYNGPANSDDEAYALALDAQGNVYVTGSSTGVGSGADYATIKYGPTGVRLWAERYDGPGDSGDAASALALDAQGNVYVAGGSTGDGTGEDYAIIKYGP